MTNKEIIQSVRSKYVTEGQVTMYTTEQIEFMLNMLREKIKNQMLDGVMTDSEFEEYTGSKRDQPQGVDVWVSWDDNNSSVAPELWIMRPRPNMNGTFTGKVHHDAISSELNLLPGQCRKFRILEVVE